MDTWFIAIRLIISFLLGAVIGLEREINEKKVMKSGQKPQAILGLRSFSIITSLGTILGLLYHTQPWISLILICSVLVLFIVFYIIDTTISKDTGITTELAMIYSFIIGILLAFNIFSIQIILALSVVFILILSKKRNIKDAVDDIRRSELDAFIAYAIISLVILPFLPNTTYSLSDINGLPGFLNSLGVNIDKIANINLINPFNLWLIVALITGIDMAGYVLEKTIGQRKGWLLASIAGGFVSSTAVSITLAQQSRTAKKLNHLLAACIVANLASFFQIIILIAPINTEFAARLIPTIASIIISAVVVFIYFIKSKEQYKKSIDKSLTKENKKEIFEFAAALKFGFIYLLIGVVSKIALAIFGNTGFLITVAIGALAGLDAVMINTAQLAGKNINFSLAIGAFIIANAINLSAKVVYSYLQGSKEYTIKFSLAIGLIIISSLIGLIFI